LKIAILYGSPRENGYTAQLVSAFCTALPEEAVIRTVRAYETPVEPCRGCGVCEREWNCPYDDMEQILGTLMQCDVIVIASPVYHLSFPAPLKAIVDRMQRCFCAHRSGRSPFSDRERKAVVLLTAGSPSEDGDIIRRQLRWLLPPLNAELCGMVVCPNTDAEGLSLFASEQAAAVAQSLARDFFDYE